MEAGIVPIHELSPTIAEALIACASEQLGGYTFAVLEPREDDLPERKKQMAAEMSEIRDLMQLDLLRDVSYRFSRQIDDCKETHGFGYKVVQLTEYAVLMFMENKHRKVN